VKHPVASREEWMRVGRVVATLSELQRLSSGNPVNFRYRNCVQGAVVRPTPRRRRAVAA
jgi:hypothetical protein